MASIQQKVIDNDKLRAFLDEHGGHTHVARQLGRSGTFFWNVFNRGKIPLTELYLLCNLYNLQPDAFDPAPEPQPEPETASVSVAETEITGYQLRSEIKGLTVRLVLTYNGKTVKDSYAQINTNLGSKDAQVASAFRTAARLIHETIVADDLRAEFDAAQFEETDMLPF